MYFADAKWWGWHKEKQEFISHAGQKCTIFNSGNSVQDIDVHMLRNKDSRGVSDDPEYICTGSNSGYQSVNIGLLTGPALVVLVAHDARGGPNGEKHWFGNHPDGTEAPYTVICEVFRQMRDILEQRESTVRIVNASPYSAVDCFERVDLESILSNS